MTEPLFFPIILLSILAWGIHGSLMVYYARAYDGLIVAVYRGLSFILVMLPLLFLSSWEDIALILQHGWTLFFASVAGAVTYITALNTVRYLPVGVGTALRQTISIFCSVLLGMLFLNEYLSLMQVAILGLMLAAGVLLSILRTEHAHLDIAKAWKGVWLSVITGGSAAVAFYLFTVLARETTPFVATYFWEVGVGVVSALYLLFLVATSRYTGRVILPFKKAAGIIGIGSLTIIASTCYALAVNYGPFALASGLVSTIILITTVAGWYLYNERLARTQLLLIGTSVALILVLKVFS